MINKRCKRYIKNKLKLCQLIKYIYKHKLLKSIIHSSNIYNLKRHTANTILYSNYTKKTNIIDVCLKSSVYKKSTKWTNFNRHEYHNLCRSNKLISTAVNSW